MERFSTLSVMMLLLLNRRPKSSMPKKQHHRLKYNEVRLKNYSTFGKFICLFWSNFV